MLPGLDKPVTQLKL